MNQKVYSPHDKFFRASFADKQSAIGFLKNYLPKSVAELLDFDSLTVENTTFIDDSMQEYRSDLLYQVTLTSGKPAYIYILCEHQKQPDGTMRLRLLAYSVKAWEYLIKKYGYQYLVPLVPLVLSQSAWPYSTRFQDMMELDEESNVALSPWIPDFNHILVDLSKLDAKEIRGNVYGKIVLHLLKSGLNGQFKAALDYWAPLLQALSQQENVTGLVEVMLRYSAQVAEDVSLNELRDFVVKNLSETAGDKLMTIAEQLEQKGREQAAADYQRQIEAAVNEKEQALEREKALLKQLQEAGIKPKVPNH